jgi:hypothetical protein
MNDFIGRLVLHIQSRYRHGVRYFGLLTPYRKNARKKVVFYCLGQPILPAPERQTFREMSLKSFNVDPELDSFGVPMAWVKTIPAKKD